MNETLDEKQAAVESELSTPEGERSFVGRIDQAVIKLKSAIKAGRAGPRVREAIEKAMNEMRIIADRIRTRNTRAASFVDEARKKYDDLLSLMGKSN